MYINQVAPRSLYIIIGLPGKKRDQTLLHEQPLRKSRIGKREKHMSSCYNPRHRKLPRLLNATPVGSEPESHHASADDAESSSPPSVAAPDVSTTSGEEGQQLETDEIEHVMYSVQREGRPAPNVLFPASAEAQHAAEDATASPSCEQVVMVLKVGTMASIPKGEYTRCPIAMEDFDKACVEHMPADLCFLEGKPQYCVGRLPCGHRFHAVSIIYHACVNGMQCPVCRCVLRMSSIDVFFWVGQKVL